jgi:transcriptional regulator with XRE-family HTH domain
MTTQTDERTEAAQELLARFRVLGLRLKEWRTRRGENADAERARIAEEIRETEAEGKRLGVFGREMADALGVSRQQLYNIVNDVKWVRTPPPRDALLVALTLPQRDALLRAAAQAGPDPELEGAVAALQRGRAVTMRTARQAVGQ